MKENRKGLEEGDDLTDAIEEFVKASVYKAVSEIEEEQRSKERERRLSAANEKKCRSSVGSYESAKQLQARAERAEETFDQTDK